MWDKNVNSQSPLHNVENHMSIGLQVASESSSEGMLSVCLSALTHPCNVLIKSNITRKRFDAGYSNLEHWSYLMPSTIRPDMTSLAISGHVSAAILYDFLRIYQFNISKLAQHKFTKFETLIDNYVSCVSSTHDTYRLIHSSGITQKLF